MRTKRQIQKDAGPKAAKTRAVNVLVSKLGIALAEVNRIAADLASVNAVQATRIKWLEGSRGGMKGRLEKAGINRKAIGLSTALKNLRPATTS